NLRLTGLAGGHSGEDIHRGRANAHKLMGRILYDWMAREPGLRLVSLRGGNKDNAIPREAEACVAALGGADGVAAMAEVLRGELCPEDGAFALEVSEAEPSELLPMDAESTQRVIFLAQTVTNGVISMCQDLPELVEFSRNMAVVKTEEEQVRVIFSSRSAKDSQIDRSAAELDAYAALLGGSTRHYNRYPGWSFEKESELREEYTAAYRKRFGREPGLEIIHAGLECGIVKEGIPDMDILSCGPVITDLHSPNEAVHLGSWERFFSVIKEMLEAK
ncbi:MAG: M20/M25/M40 family metallo-hydrolase, partial [Clostridia bacterium]|nr:M20/M25/M40 family metallo-hydrolase [Clostridia bacterium]